MLRSVKQQVILHYAAVPAQPCAGLWADWAPRLSATRRAEIGRLREPQDRNSTLLGLVLLESALAGLGLPLNPAAIFYTPRGKPRLSAGPDFSISHAAGLVGCAVAVQGAIGFDLERKASVTPDQLRLALGVAEHAQLTSGALDATDAWVMTEAVLKAAGAGVADAPRVRLVGPEAALDGRRWWLTAAAVGGGHVAWLAHDPAAISLTVVRAGPDAVAQLS